MYLSAKNVGKQRKSNRSLILLRNELRDIRFVCSGPPELVWELLRASCSLLLCRGKLRDTGFFKLWAGYLLQSLRWLPLAKNQPFQVWCANSTAKEVGAGRNPKWMGVLKVVLQAPSAPTKHPPEMQLGGETDLLWWDRHPGHLLERRMEHDLF